MKDDESSVVTVLFQLTCGTTISSLQLSTNVFVQLQEGIVVRRKHGKVLIISDLLKRFVEASLLENRPQHRQIVTIANDGHDVVTHRHQHSIGHMDNALLGDTVQLDQRRTVGRVPVGMVSAAIRGRTWEDVDSNVSVCQFRLQQLLVANVLNVVRPVDGVRQNQITRGHSGSICLTFRTARRVKCNQVLRKQKSTH